MLLYTLIQSIHIHFYAILTSMAVNVEAMRTNPALKRRR